MKDYMKEMRFTPNASRRAQDTYMKTRERIMQGVTAHDFKQGVAWSNSEAETSKMNYINNAVNLRNNPDEIFASFSQDHTHPTNDGHKLMAKALCYFLRGQINRAADTPNTYPTVPSVSGYDCYTNLQSFDHDTAGAPVTSLGGFAAANTGTPSTRDQSDVTAFQQGWKKSSSSPNTAMVINATCKNFVLIYEAGNKSVAGDPTGNIVVSWVNDNDPTDTGELTWDLTKTMKQPQKADTPPGRSPAA